MKHERNTSGLMAYGPYNTQAIDYLLLGFMLFSDELTLNVTVV